MRRRRLPPAGGWGGRFFAERDQPAVPRVSMQGGIAPAMHLFIPSEGIIASA